MSESAGLTRALRHRPFLWLFVGQAVSQFGSSLHRLAMAWWVLTTTGSGLAMGTVMICSVVPMVPFLFIGGALVDRFDRVRIMLVSDVVRGLLSTLVAVLMATDRLELWHLYVVSVAFGTFDALFGPAVMAVIATAVPPQDRTSANSLRALSNQLSSVFGPMIAAAVIAVGETSVAFAVDAASYFISALALWPLLRLKLTPKRADADQATLLADIRDGLAYVRREPWLWISMVVFFFINAAGLPPYAIGIPYVVTQVQQQSATVFGIIEALAAAGAIVAAIWLGRRQHLSRRGWLIYGTVIASGVFGLALGLPISIYGIGGLVVLGSFVNTVMVLVWVSLMQDRVPAEQFGRVAGIDQASAVITAPLGFAAFGWALDQTDAIVVFVIAGGITALSGVVALMCPALREID